MTGHLIAQEARFSLPYTRYTVSSGLPQMQVRSLYVERNGLIWVGTQGGLAIYDGHHLRTPGNIGPVAEEYIQGLARGSAGLYISTLSGVYLFDGQDARRISADILRPKVLFEDPAGFLWVSASVSRTVVLYKDGVCRSVEEAYPFLLDVEISQAWGHATWKNIYLTDANNRFYSYSTDSHTLHIDSTTLRRDDILFLPSAVRSDREEDVMFYRVDKEEPSKRVVQDVFRLVNGALLRVAGLDKTAMKMKAFSEKAPAAFAGRWQHVNRVFVREGPYYRLDKLPPINGVAFVHEAYHKFFIGTDEGLYIVHADGLEDVVFPACDYAWSVTPGYDSDIYVACYKSGIFHLDSAGRQLDHLLLPAMQENVEGAPDQVLSNVLLTPDQILWGGNNCFLFLQRNARRLNFVPGLSSTEAFSRDPADGSIWAGSRQIFRFSPDLRVCRDSIRLAREVRGAGSINDMLVSANRDLWIAAAGGIERIPLAGGTPEVFRGEAMTLPCLGAVTLDFDAAGNLWSGGTCGLMVRRAKTNRFDRVLPDIITHRVNQLTLLPGRRLVCAANNNLYLIRDDGPAPSVVAIYSEENGLNLYEPSENGSCLTDDRYIWFPSVAGIQRLDLTRVPERFDTPVLCVDQVNGKPFAFLREKAEKPRVEGSSALLGVLISDHSGKSWRFQYKKDNGAFSPWQSGNEILVAGLRHGVNGICLRAAWNPEDPLTYVSLDFPLQASLPVFARHQVQWALGAITCLLIGLVTVSIRRARRNALQADILRGELYKNQLRAIQAYFSPHFFFNTLASIQNRLLQHDAEKSNEMIVRLARVFRKVLETGKGEKDTTSFIRLSSEISIVEDMVYLYTMQSMRPVTFTLEVEDTVREEDPMIPPMLIEPFVENALKHAFTDEMEDRRVSLKILWAGNSLLIRIQDNGVGLGKARDTQGTSMGTRLARERMNILNALHIENSLNLSPASPRGTLVTILIQRIP